MSLVFFLRKSVICMSWTWIIVFNSVHQTMAQQMKADGSSASYKLVPLGFYLGIQFHRSDSTQRKPYYFMSLDMKEVWRCSDHIKQIPGLFMLLADINISLNFAKSGFIISHQAKPGCHSLVLRS